MTTPRVSFVVPCYKLAHLLPQCIDSLLCQTYADFEVLIMNDKSPDNTSEIARSYSDPRVICVDNADNLGHLRNYNHGITLSRGTYVWLISADDYLRSPDVLSKYVELMDARPRVGYCVCPGFSVKNGKEGGVIGRYDDRDCVVKGHVFLDKLLDYNFVLAASVLVRKTCYDSLGMFPLEADWAGMPVDMGWLGDWYLWCIFAMHYDVGYFATPMVCYRDHDLSMTVTITQKDSIAKCAASDVGMLWMLRQKARDSGMTRLVKQCLRAIGNEYYRQGATKHYRNSRYRLSPDEFEQSIDRSTQSNTERRRMRASYLEGLADGLRHDGDYVSAKLYYWASIKNRVSQFKAPAKLLLLSLGGVGQFLRTMLRRHPDHHTNPIASAPPTPVPCNSQAAKGSNS